MVNKRLGTKTRKTSSKPELPVWDLDADIENADWTKSTWDLPPYKSAEFFSIFPVERLENFRQLPVYKAAVAAGLILDDEWLADYIQEPRE